MPESDPTTTYPRGGTALLAILTFVALLLVLCYRIVEPFFIPLLWGIAIAVVFWPLNQKLRRFGPNWVGALICTLLVLLLLAGPITYLGAALIDQAGRLTRKIQAGNYQSELDLVLHFDETPFFRAIVEKLSPWVDISGLDFKSLLLDSVSRLTELTVNQTSQLITNFSVFVLYLGVMIMAMFFLFRDGDRLLHQVKNAIPLTVDQTEKLFTMVRQVVWAALYGGVLIAIVQGTLGGLVFFILGLGAPVLWGVVMGFLSFIPVLGPGFVYVPAAVILFVQGSIIKGILMLGFGFGVVSTVDNVLRPFVVSGRTKMHTMVLFIAILGGLNLFGLLGLVMGPVIAAIFISFFNFYQAELARTRMAELPEPPKE